MEKVTEMEISNLIKEKAQLECVIEISEWSNHRVQVTFTNEEDDAKYSAGKAVALEVLGVLERRRGEIRKELEGLGIFEHIKDGENYED